MKKAFVMIGLISFLIGVFLAVFPTQVSYTKEIDKWNIGFCTIRPKDPGPCWGRRMSRGTFLELNISASDTVRVRIGVPVYDKFIHEMVLKNITFSQVGTNFTQKVEISESGAYQVEIKNEGTNPVNVWGSVSAKKTIHQTVHPYSSLATPIVLGSLVSLIYGVSAKSKKRYIKMKHRRRNRSLYRNLASHHNPR